jgi:hypothetical protein
VLELRAHDAFRPESEAVAIEADRALEVVDAEGDESDTGFHVGYQSRVTGHESRFIRL